MNHLNKMAQVSKYPIPEKIYQRILEIFLKTLIGLKNKKDAEQFINDLLTPTEKVMLVKRLAIAFLLEREYDYRTISKILRVSLPTIASVNSARKYGGKGYQKIMTKLLREEKVQDFFLQVAEALSGNFSKSSKGGGVWRYLHHEIKKERTKRPF